MKTISSAEFRKTYPSLTEPVVITANGRAIGEWVPYLSPQRIAGEFRNIGRPADRGPRPDKAMQDFRPVPKPSQRK